MFIQCLLHKHADNIQLYTLPMEVVYICWSPHQGTFKLLNLEQIYLAILDKFTLHSDWSIYLNVEVVHIWWRSHQSTQREGTFQLETLTSPHLGALALRYTQSLPPIQIESTSLSFVIFKIHNQGLFNFQSSSQLQLHFEYLSIVWSPKTLKN